MRQESFVTLPLSLLEASIDHPQLTIKRLVYSAASNRRTDGFKGQNYRDFLFDFV